MAQHPVIRRQLSQGAMLHAMTAKHSERHNSGLGSVVGNISNAARARALHFVVLRRIIDARERHC